MHQCFVFSYSVSQRWIWMVKKPFILNSMIILFFKDLLDLDPLPLSVLKNDLYQSIYDFKYFNPIQTQVCFKWFCANGKKFALNKTCFRHILQVFFSLFHSDDNLLIGAPTGSGKTLCAELAIFRLINQQPEKKVDLY